jgi:hypothetical protein
MSVWIRYAIICTWLFSLGWAAAARAQGDWIVVPYGTGKNAQAERAAESVVRALVARRVPVLSLHETRDRWVAHSRKPHETTAEDRARLREATARTLEHAAYGRKAEARSEARTVFGIAERSMETLNRDSDSARLVLDACLSLVRVDLQANDRSSAVQQAARCRRYVPDLLPKESQHPADVIGALAEADNQLRRSGAEALTVQAAGESCPVFMNGRRVGTTPFHVEGAAPGEWRIQVECGDQISRVHVVRLGDAPVTLNVTPDRDQRIDYRDILTLRYANEADERKHLADDARALANGLNVAQVVLVRARGAGDALMVRWDRERATVVATASLLLDERGIESLLREEQAERVPLAFLTPKSEAAPASTGPKSATESGPTTDAPQSGPSATSDAASEEPNATLTTAAPSERRRRVWTWVLGGSALAVGGGATGLYFAARNQRNEHSACIDQAAEESECTSLESHGKKLLLGANISFGVAGALLTGAVVAFFLEGRAESPPKTALLLGPQSVGVQHSF